MTAGHNNPFSTWTEEKFKLAIDSAPSGVVLIDHNGIILLVNTQVERIFGYAREELIGQPIEVLIPERFRNNHPSLRNAYMDAPTARAMGVGRELFGLHKNGAEIPVEIGLNPLRFDFRLYVMATIVDISERKRVENLFQLAVEASPNGMVMVDDQRKIVLTNSQLQKIFGYTREELLGQSIEILVPVRFRPGHPDQFNSYMKTPSTRAMGAGRELFGLHKDGTEIPVEIGLNPTVTQGRVFVMASVVDISERKKAEAEQKKLQEQIQHGQRLESLGVLAGGIAHDFNNILVAVLGHADLGLMELPANSPVRTRLDNIKNASIRASKLTKQMLAYAGKGRFAVGPVCMNTLVREMALLLEVSVSRKVVFRTELADPLPPITADSAQVQQVIMNLITNASEAIGDKSGMIAVNTGVVKTSPEYLKDFYLYGATEGYYVFLEVSDTGCGMSKEVQSHMFDPFFTTKFTGRGLGMAAVLGIIRGHHGAIRVYSEEGRGTKIKVLFPISEPLQATNHTVATPDLSTLSKSKRVLIVDDEEHVRGVLGFMLNKCGFDTVFAGNGREGLMQYHANHTDLAAIFLDMNMPGLDGTEVFKEIQKHDPNVIVIIMSGYNQREATFSLTGKNFSAFLQKPFELNDVVKVVKKAFGVEKNGNGNGNGDAHPVKP